MRQMEDAKLFVTNLLLAIQDSDDERLKEMLRMNSSDHTKKSKVFSNKTLKQKNTEKRRQKLSLVSAIKQNDQQKVRNLLAINGSDCNIIQESLSYTKHREAFYPIHTAVTLDLIDITEILLTAGAHPNVFDHCGNTPLHVAVSRGNTMTTKLLLSFGADPALTDRRGNASIHNAASQGHLNIVRTLIEFDADVHQTDSIGYQPIHFAAAAGHFHITHLLCSVDASNIAARSRDGQFPLHLAAENGHVETVTALLDLFSANPNERNSSGETPVLRLLRKPYRGRSMRDMDSYYATFMALVQFGASLDVVDGNGKAILDLAVDNQYTKIASVLKTLRGGDDVIQHRSYRVKDFCTSRADMNTFNGPAKSEDLLNVDVNCFNNRNARNHDSEQCLLTQDLEFSSFHSQKIDQKTYSDSKETSLCERTPSDSSEERILHLPQNISNRVKSENAQRSNPDLFVEKTSNVTTNQQQTNIAKTSHHIAETADMHSKGSHIQHNYVNEIPQHHIKLNTEKKPKNKRKCSKLPALEGNESSLGTELAINTHPVEAEIGKQSGSEASSSSKDAHIGQKKLTKSRLQEQMPNNGFFHVKSTSVSDAAGSKSVKSKKKSKPGNERNEKPGRSLSGEFTLLNGDSLFPSSDETQNAHWPQEDDGVTLIRTNSSKVSIKRKKRKNSPTVEPIYGLSSADQEYNKMNGTSQKQISQFEEYGVTDVDSIPFYTDFSSEDRGSQCGLKEYLDSESEYSGGELKERHSTREIQSELCSAFGISKETNIDDVFLNTNGKSGNNNISELELFCELNDFRKNMQQMEEKKSFPRKSKLSGKSKALHKSFEIVLNTDRNHPEDSEISSASCDVEVSNGRACNRRRRRKSPCFCLKLDSSNTHSSPLLPPEKEEEPKSFITDRDRHSSASYSSSNSNSYGLQIANVSKETCIDDDYKDERSDEQKTSPNQPLLSHSDHGFKETDIDEVFCSDKMPVRYDLQQPIGECVLSVYTNDVRVCDDRLNVNGSLLVDNRSVVVDLPRKKKLPKKKKLKNNSVRIPDPSPVSDVVQLSACDNSYCSDIQSKACKKQIRASSEIIESRFEEHFDRGKNENKDLLDGKINLTVEDNDVDKQTDHRTKVGQSSDEANVSEEQTPKANENDTDDETLSLQEESTAPSSSGEDSQTELDALENNFDDAKKDLIFGQSRVLFTIQEMNAEELGSHPVVKKIVKCNSSEEQDEWDDLDLSKSLEKIKLKGQILNIRRHSYDETDEEEKDEKNLNNVYNSSTRDQTSPMLKSFTISPLMAADKTFTMPGSVANSCRSPVKQPGCSSRSVAKPSGNRCEDDVEKTSGSEEDKPKDCSETNRTQMKKQMSDRESFIETSFDGLEPVSRPLSNAGCPSDRAADTGDNSSAVILRCDAVSDSQMKQNNSQLHVTSDKESTLCKTTEFVKNVSETHEAMKQNKLVHLATNDSDDITKERIMKVKSAEEEEEEEERETEEEERETEEEERETEEEELEGEKQDGIKQEREKQEGEKQEKEKQEEIKESHNVLDLKPIIDSTFKEEDFSEHFKSNRIPSGQHSPINAKNDDHELENKSDRNKENVVVNENTIKEFTTSEQLDRLGKRHGKKTIHRPLNVGNSRTSLLVFESAPETDTNAKPSLAERGLESNKSENLSKSGSKSVSFHLPSHSDKPQSNFPKLLDDTQRNESVSRLKSDVTISDKQKPYGKPPVAQHINKGNTDESINKMTSPRTIVSGDGTQANMVKISPTTGNQSDKSSNNSHTVQESKPGLSGTFSNVRNPKFLIESNLIRQQSRSNKIPVHHTLAQRSSHEDSLFSKKSHKSVKHTPSFERPRSAEGILEAQRYQPNRPSSRQSMSSVLRSPGGMRNESVRRQSDSVKEPQRTLQEAAFESIRASILSQPKQQTRRPAKQSAVPLSYRPPSVSFQGSLSHDDSQTSADFVDHKSTQSVNKSWQGDF